MNVSEDIDLAINNFFDVVQPKYVRHFDHFYWNKLNFFDCDVSFKDESCLIPHDQFGPAITCLDGSFAYLENGSFHRKDGFAVELYQDGGHKQYCFKDNLLHKGCKEDLPAYQDSWGTKIWAQQGLLHRSTYIKVKALRGNDLNIHNPAVFFPNGNNYFFVKGKPFDPRLQIYMDQYPIDYPPQFESGKAF